MNEVDYKKGERITAVLHTAAKELDAKGLPDYAAMLRVAASRLEDFSGLTSHAIIELLELENCDPGRLRGVAFCLNERKERIMYHSVWDCPFHASEDSSAGLADRLNAAAGEIHRGVHSPGHGALMQEAALEVAALREQLAQTRTLLGCALAGLGKVEEDAREHVNSLRERAAGLFREGGQL